MNYKNPKTITVYVDLLNQEHPTEKEAYDSSHKIHLNFRKYIEEELLATFSDGGIDKLATTQNIWDVLEFTPECIQKICSIILI